ncbi:MAG TPA: hypothetical protein VMF06_23095 [Candidatus Limnocylindria bacterium]|jgi:cell shape-determining protein MreC|nr:hypothetical protein [Candidatus Limnocylindria bacterium]
MLRIALILALVASIASVAISFTVVKPRVDDLVTNLATRTSELAASQAEATAAKKDAKEAKADAAKANKELAQTKTDLETAQNDSTMQRTRADKLATELSKTTKDKNEAQERLAQWNVLNVTPDQVMKLKVDIKNVGDARDALDLTAKAQAKKIGILESRLSKYEGDDVAIEMPGLKGSVLAVDPKWEFVVLDVGSNQGAKERGMLLVRRGDKLVGKVKLIKVDENRSEANILPEWKQGNVAVAPGDAVLY